MYDEQLYSACFVLFSFPFFKKLVFYSPRSVEKMDTNLISFFSLQYSADVATQPNFSRDFFGLGSRCAVLFFKVFKKVEKNRIYRFEIEMQSYLF